MSDIHDDPSKLGDMETERPESVALSVSVISDDSKQDEQLKKKRKSKKKPDAYKSRKRSRSSKPAAKSEEYEVEMIIDHKTDEEVRTTFSTIEPVLTNLKLNRVMSFTWFTGKGGLMMMIPGCLWKIVNALH